ncbi:MAG: dehydrogenase, short-chain alcohol dehydrogenase like protein [Acidimicrobiales bacterium]|nr:dehydrogenase, short-chain alcohol dehydrogenase like protein [Acidimicrobiales bacterium]
METDEIPSPAELFDLTGKVALVTGGSRGLGRQMALGFAKAGADIVVTSRKIEACREVVEEIEASTGRQAMAYGCHVGHWDELSGLVDAAYERFGHVDVLVNNAGKSVLYESLESVTKELWESTIAVNMTGPFRLCALVGSRMVEHGGGSIINVSTIGSIRPSPHIVPYAAAKAGLNAMTIGFAHAFGPTVRVNCLMPGPFFTDVSAAWDLEAFGEAAQAHALRRGGQPREVIGTALYLASDASSFTTGATVRVDGGIP